MKIVPAVLILASSIVASSAHGVATSSQSMISGEGWRYGYGIAHGPPGIGHAVGESFPHGYGGFGTYAPSYGYNLAPPPLPPHPVVVKLPPTYVLPPSPVVPVAPHPVGPIAPIAPHPYGPVEPILPPIKPLVFPKPIQLLRPSYPYRTYQPYQHYQHYRPYYYLDEDDDDDDHYGYDHDNYYHHEEPFLYHKK